MLFGHQNDDTNQTTNNAPGDTGVQNPLAVDPVTGASLPAVPDEQIEAETPSSILNQPAVPPLPADDASATAPVIEDADSTSSTESVVNDVSSYVDIPAPVGVIQPAADTSLPADDVAATDLLTMKQNALTQLSPLIGQLDQTPEEKFRTTMMMIQSTDNQALLKDAYDAAQAITDEKNRAQALLDIVNEINYFTQPKTA